ncbi:MAG TPA: ABC transporter substrate-binding protein [Candidatus Limnocylindria bacterium]
MRHIRTPVLGAALLALVMSACSPGGDGSSPSAAGESQAAASQTADLPTVIVGSAGFWESAVVAEIWAQALEGVGFTVERNLELGGRDVTQPALIDGELNLMPEYIGGLLAQYYEGEPTPDVDESLEALRTALEADGLLAFDPTPGTDADGFAVRSETASDLSLETMSDLAAVAGDLRWGVALECADNPNCGPGLDRVYGIDLTAIDDVQTLEACTTAIAEALNSDNIDVAQVCTTQPEIVAFNLVLLEDDLGLAPAQNIVPVVRQDLADEAGDLLETTLNAVSALLTTEQLTELGNAVVINGDTYADAAAQWLEDNGL